MYHPRLHRLLYLLSAALLFLTIPLPISALARGQETPDAGSVRGHVTLEDGEAVAGATVLVLDLGRSVRTDDEGDYELMGIPAGTYRLLARREGLGSRRLAITVEAGAAAQADFVLEVASASEEVTITASTTGETSTFDAFNAVSALDSLELAKNAAPTIGEALADEPGVAKRGFGPGSARPIIRGFDGDRVLIMSDGIRTGDLSSQSGDHGISIDPASVHRVEVVKGPATLLYGSNAVGGVVNTITQQQALRTGRHQGLEFGFTADGGTANEQAGGNGSLTWSEGDVALWLGAGSRRTGDYDTPEGPVENSATELSNGRIGVGYFGDGGFFSVGYNLEDGRFGIPFADEFHAHGREEDEDDAHGSAEVPQEHGDEEDHLEIDLSQQRQSLRLEGGLSGLGGGLVDSFQVALNYLSWQHEELEIAEGMEEVATTFDNQTWVARAEFEQRRTGRLHGKFGVWTQHRDYVASGEEALSPPTTQSSLAGFAYEELDFDGWRLQFGGRVEHNAFDPGIRATTGHEHEEEEGHGGEGEHGGTTEEEHHHEEGLETPAVRSREFTGLSGSAGVHVDLPRDLALVANFTRSYRAPALEELYNFGPHVGNLTFEIGNPDLEAETTSGLDLSLRHRSERVSAQVNLFWYDVDEFVFPAFTGESEDGLQVAEFLQGDSRSVGLDAEGSVRLHPKLWLNLSSSFVDAELTDTGESLPRIPPLQGGVGLEIVPMRGLVIEPEVRLAADQREIFRNETSTSGYTVYDLAGSYTLIRGQMAHVFAVTGYNLGDRLYRNHSSFIKDLAPEIGRGIKFSYALRFF